MCFIISSLYSQKQTKKLIRLFRNISFIEKHSFSIHSV